MRRITVTENISLDGVMQGPMAPDEDDRNGFTLGGWARAGGADPELGAVMGAGMARSGAMLFGHRTYDAMAAFWPHQTDGNPFTEHLDNTEKFVVSRDASVTFDWQNSTLLAGEAVQTVRALKETDGGDLSVLGSGALVRALAPAGLIDEYTLVIHPLVLGSGQRLFEGVQQHLTLLESQTTRTGITVARYAPRT